MTSNETASDQPGAVHRRLRGEDSLKALRLGLARTLFEFGLWRFGDLVLPEGGVLLLDGGATMVFRHSGRLETRRGSNKKPAPRQEVARG